MFEMYLFETTKQLEELEQIMMMTEETGEYTSEDIDAIFRIMHTIKGSSAMMTFDYVATLAHKLEDVYFSIREEQMTDFDHEELLGIVLESIDYIKQELEGLRGGTVNESRSLEIIARIECFIDKQSPKGFNHKVKVFFNEQGAMEDIHAFSLVQRLNSLTDTYEYEPAELMGASESAQRIREEGFCIQLFTEKGVEEVKAFFEQTPFLSKLEVEELTGSENQIESLEVMQSEAVHKEIGTVSQAEAMNTADSPDIEIADTKEPKLEEAKSIVQSQKESIMSVNANRIERIMDLLGEIVIAQSMVIENPDLVGLNLENFNKSARQLTKITSELQNEIMSIRMVTMSSAFYKMKRLVRDMSKKLDKKVKLTFVGEETEVDKKVIECITDPLMHMVRNAMDHGIETTEERKARFKSEEGHITLEARHEGKEVIVLVKDDGKGISKETILDKAEKNKLLVRPRDEYTDEEIYKLIFLPGFSTKEGVSEFSGRGVGMDVVVKNIEAIGGSVTLESAIGRGSTFIIRIPLTMAIIDGMHIRVGQTSYTLPTIAIQESFRPSVESIITGVDGSEMLVIRGECYPIIRLHEIYEVQAQTTELTEGVVIRIGTGEKQACLFVDEILGGQQVVIKPLPKYITKVKKISGISGCTLLGDGSISLILDYEGIIEKAKMRGKINASRN